MKIKIRKIVASLLLLTFISFDLAPLSASANSEETLYDFMQTTKDISASYAYPSYKLSANGVGKSLLKAHTPIMIKCTETITTKDVVSGGIVNFEILEDVKDINGVVLIKSGTPVTAEITFAKSSKMIGRAGELTVNDFHTTAVDGTYIPLSGSVAAKPDDEMVTSIVLSVLICPLFLLMKGEEARLNAGSTKTAYTIVDTYIKPVRL